MPISAAARAMRMAISPRFAIRSVFMLIGAILTPLRVRCRWPVARALPDAGHIVEGSTRRGARDREHPALHPRHLLEIGTAIAAPADACGRRFRLPPHPC